VDAVDFKAFVFNIMRYSSTINNVNANEWGLSIQQAYLFAWFYELPSWANKVMIENEIYYFASKNKAVEELPILTDKTDTMYRYYKQLEDLGLVHIKKIDNKDYIALTNKAKDWNFYKSEYSENNPTLLGNLSENNSENNPTYNNIISNNNNIDNKKQILFSDCIYNDYQTLKNKLAKDDEFVKNYAFVNLKHYIEDCLLWSDAKNQKRTERGWLATLRNFMKKDLEDGKLKKIERPNKPQGHTNH
jgi:hypothetical protein